MGEVGTTRLGVAAIFLSSAVFNTGIAGPALNPKVDGDAEQIIRLDNLTLLEKK